MVSTAGARFGVATSGQSARAIFFSPKIPRNLLKSLISDEGIQGNPSFSNPQKRGFSQRNAEQPRKPKSIG
jgi:hypothetical protein